MWVCARLGARLTVAQLDTSDPWSRSPSGLEAWAAPLPAAPYKPNCAQASQGMRQAPEGWSGQEGGEMKRQDRPGARLHPIPVSHALRGPRWGSAAEVEGSLGPPTAHMGPPYAQLWLGSGTHIPSHHRLASGLYPDYRSDHTSSSGDPRGHPTAPWYHGPAQEAL